MKKAKKTTVKKEVVSENELKIGDKVIFKTQWGMEKYARDYFDECDMVYAIKNVKQYDGTLAMKVQLANHGENMFARTDLEKLTYLCDRCIRSMGVYSCIKTGGTCDNCGMVEEHFGNWVAETDILKADATDKPDANGLWFRWIFPEFQCADLEKSCCPNCANDAIDKVLANRKGRKSRYDCNSCGYELVNIDSRGTEVGVNTDDEMKRWLFENKQVLKIGETIDTKRGKFTLCKDACNIGQTPSCFFLSEDFGRVGDNFYFGQKVSYNKRFLSVPIIAKMLGFQQEMINV